VRGHRREGQKKIKRDYVGEKKISLLSLISYRGRFTGKGLGGGLEKDRQKTSGGKEFWRRKGVETRLSLRVSTRSEYLKGRGNY